MSREKFDLIFTEQKDIAPGVRHFVFKRKDENNFDFIPGQFINIFFEHEGELLQRSYSLANSPSSGTLEFAVSYIKAGRASEFLFNLKPGDTLQASGPFGRLTLREETPERYVLVATGTGVTPYRSMLPELARRLAQGSVKEVIILLGARMPELLLYRSEFAAFAKQNPAVRFIGCCSQASADVLAGHEHLCNGYVQHQFERLGLTPEKDMVFLCGNPDMIDAAYAQLTAMGFGATHVRREKYVFSH